MCSPSGSVMSSQLGVEHTKWQQALAGIPRWGVGEMVVQWSLSESTGTLMVETMNGIYVWVGFLWYANRVLHIRLFGWKILHILHSWCYGDSNLW